MEPAKEEQPVNVSEEIKEKATSNGSDTAVKKSDMSDSSDERHVHLHAKTFLAVFAACLIYTAQLVNLIGAGAVS